MIFGMKYKSNLKTLCYEYKTVKVEVNSSSSAFPELVICYKTIFPFTQLCIPIFYIFFCDGVGTELCTRLYLQHTISISVCSITQYLLLATFRIIICTVPLWLKMV